MKPREEQPLVRIASASNQAVAEMWREMLGNNGIAALVRIAGPLTAYATFASPHDLLVLAADAPAARDLLAAFNEDERDLAPGLAEKAGDDGDEEPYWMDGAEEEEPR